MDFSHLCYHCMQDGVYGDACRCCGVPAGFRQTIPHALPVGTVLHGSYLVGAALGAGGFGVTYIARHIASGRRVAIKEYYPVDFARRSADGLKAIALSAEFEAGRASFFNEAQTIHSLRGYDGIVRVEKLFMENNTAYYCMEYLDGCDLKKYVQQRGGRLSTAETQTILSPMLDALRFIHTNGVIHRDVSPDNIFICANGDIKLIDFGAALGSIRLSAQAQQLVVKRGYAPIEQYSSDGVLGAWTDLYAFGCTMYFCLTGAPPPDALVRLKHDDLIPPSACGADLLPEQERALLCCMAVNANERYPTVEAFRDAFFGRATLSDTAVVRSVNRVMKKTFFGRMRLSIDLVSERIERIMRRVSSIGRGVVMELVCTEGEYSGSRFPITRTPLRMGRDPERCALVFSSRRTGVSRLHCEVYRCPDGMVALRDLGSTCGTFYGDGRRALTEEIVYLNDGDSFSIGGETFMVLAARREE